MQVLVWVCRIKWVTLLFVTSNWYRFLCWVSMEHKKAPKHVRWCVITVNQTHLLLFNKLSHLSWIQQFTQLKCLLSQVTDAGSPVGCLWNVNRLQDLLLYTITVNQVYVWDLINCLTSVESVQRMLFWNTCVANTILSVLINFIKWNVNIQIYMVINIIDCLNLVVFAVDCVVIWRIVFAVEEFWMCGSSWGDPVQLMGH